MTIFTVKQQKNTILILLIALALLITYGLREFLNAFLGAIILYVLLKPLFLYLKRRIGRVTSAITIIVTSFVIIIIPFFSLGVMIVNRLSSLKNDQFRISALISRLDDFVGLKLNKPHLINSYISKLTVFIEDLFPSVLSGTFAVFITLVIMYFLLYFMFVQYESFEKYAIKYAPLNKNQALQFSKELKETTYSNILGQGLIAFVQGSLVTFIFLVLGVDDSIFWGIIAFFLSFMPVIGAPVVTLPAAIIMFLNEQTWQGTTLVLFTLIVIINIDNVIRFIINKKLANTHPIVTILGVIIGLPLFGFVGLVFGPLIIVWFLHFFRVYEDVTTV
jgi:predicted PurR-regulated permease PerM